MKDFNLEKKKQIESGFKVPDGYFDSFSEKVMTQISSESLKEDTKVVSLFDRNKKWILSIAATFVVMFSAGYYFYNENKIETETTEIENFIVDQSGITDEEIVMLLDQNDINKITVDYNLDHNSIESLDVETLDLEENL